MEKKQIKGLIAPFILSIFLIVVDQITKYYAFTYLRPIGGTNFLPGFIRLTYVENRGAAFGIFQNHTFILGMVSLLLIVVGLIYIIRGHIQNKPILWTCFIILAGGIGNVIDRFSRGFVVDLFQFDISFLKAFPVFNVADCYVTVGAVLLCIFIINLESKKDEDKLEEN